MKKLWDLCKIAWTMFMLISWSSGKDSCPGGLPKSCVCGSQLVNNQSLWTVNCARLSQKDPSFLSFVPLYTEAIILQDVVFTSEPEPDSFELTSVEDSQPFLTVRYLRFENLFNLLNVPLHSVLCSFPNLEYAHLPNNTLRLATFNASCVPKLKVLNLQWNHVHYVLNNTLPELESLPDLTLDLRHNRFVCDCNLSPMLHWLPHATIHVVESNDYICSDGYPEDVSGYRLLRINASLLRCQPDIETFDQTWVRSEHNFGYLLFAVLGLLLVVAFAVLSFGFYFNFPHVRRWVKRVDKKPMMQRRRYATLDTPA